MKREGRVGESYDQARACRTGIDPGTAQAQVTLEVSKITCEQYNAYRITNPHNIAIWVNGYYHGKRGDVTLDTQGLVENARKLRDYCRRNPQTLVMQAVETLFAKER